LHLISSLETGGAQSMLCNLVLRSQGQGQRHRVVAMMDGGSQTDILRAGGIPVGTLGMSRGRPTLGGLLRFARILRRTRPRIVQSWLYHADLLGLLGRPVAGARVVWNIRSAMHGGLDALVTQACARLSALPDAIVVNSETGRRIHEERGYRPRRWCLIGNGFDLDVFKPSAENREAVRRELRLHRDTPLVGLIGRFDPLKGHGTFLDAAAIVARRFDGVHFLLAGEGVVPHNPALADRIATHGFRDRVHLLGRRADVARLTAALDIASCTSTGEAFPNIVGEAMASGVPCVVTDVGDAPRIVGNPDLVVPSGSAQALSDLWTRLLQMEPAGRQALGSKARQRIAELYSLPAVVQQYAALYRSLVEQ
jgi:glycosyltransferase involved in cell wall biosynthesis